MKEINLNEINRLPGESRYGADCTFVAAHLWPVHVPDGTGQRLLLQSFCISHIPVGHISAAQDGQVSQAQDVLERPLPWAAANTHALHGRSSVAGGRKPGATPTSPNRGF